jgi:hypothetical protein
MIKNSYSYNANNDKSGLWILDEFVKQLEMLEKFR